MTSIERILTALRHQEPDRVPLGEWGIDHDHVSKIIGRHTYWRNRRDCTLAYWEGRRDEVVAGKIRDYAELINMLDYDLIPVDFVPPKNYRLDDPPQPVGEGKWCDSKGKTYIYSASNDSIAAVQHASEGKEHLKEEEIECWLRNASNIDETRFEVVDAIMAKFGKDRAVIFRGLSVIDPLFALFGGGQEHRLMIPLIAPDEVRKMMDPVFEYNKILIDILYEKGVRFVMQGSDLGDNRSCIYPPVILREFFFPVLKRTARYCHSKGMHIFFHCCGNVWEVIDDFVDAEMEAYQSIQGTASMELRKVKGMYGSKLTLWAGIQCETLIQGTQAEVEKEVCDSLEACMPGGGFFFGSTNSVQFGAKTENYCKALDTLRKYGNYK